MNLTVLVLCSLCLLLDGFDVQAMGYVAPAVTQEWKISPAALGNVFGAAPLGVLIGSLLFSMIADRVGRRPVLIGLTFYFAIATLLTARAASPTELLIIRFLAGIGLGGIMPNAVSLVGEFSPARSRVLTMMVVGNFFSLGAALGGFLAAWIIPEFGWRSVFYVGGAIPLLIAAAMWVRLPESPSFKTAIPSSGVPILQLFAEGRAMGTLGLWTVNFMNLLNLYFLSNWLPTLVRDAGYTTRTAVLLGATLQLAGVLGTPLLSWLITRIGFMRALASGFLCGALSIAWIGQPGLSLTLLYSVVAIAGIGVVGGQSGVNAFAATLYPTRLRSTGVGAGLGVGRIGAIVGPVIAGQLLALQWKNDQLFLAAAIPAAISAVVMLSLRAKADAEA
jgi:AAHS family 4-hydroxybenzoate transporter-like MFS transporter